jgi:amino acid adenylation domain-containing protein
MEIRLALEKGSQQNPNSPALLSLERAPLTYSRLLTHCHRTIADLNHAGILRGDRVAIVLPNGPEMAACMLAVATGASCAPLNPNYRRAEFEFYLTDLAPRALIVEEGTDLPAVEVAESLGIRVIRLRPSTGDAAGIFTLDLEPAPENVAPVFAEAGDETLVLHTSGTTARPKMVPLTQSNLMASAGNIAASLGLEALDRCLNVMPLFHIHGFVGALLSTIASGGSFVCTPGFQAPRFLDWCDEFAPTWYTAVPTMHQAVLARAAENPARVANGRFRFIRSCSAPLAPQLMAELEQAFRVPVLEAYGMTEASHQIATNPQPPAARKPGSVGRASGTDVAIMDADGNMLAPEEIGEIVLRGAGVTSGYANNPEANRTSFVNGWFRTGDNGRIDRDGYLFITGRIKEIINRGGQKISPREIDEVLCTHPAVANAVAFAIPDHRLGEDVAAAVVLRPGHAASEIEIRNHAANRIAQYKVPRRIVFLDELPKGPTGKLQRIGLAAQLGLDGSAADSNSSGRANEFVAPSTPTERTLTSIWGQVLGAERVGVHDDFLALGGDSMLAALIIARIREAIGAPISILAFFEHPTVAELAGLIDRGGEDRLNANNPIVAASTDGDLPLSSAQRRMWFLAQLEEHSTAYNRSNLYRIRGALDLRALERALNSIVARHAVLRTIFQSRDGDPVQIVTAPAAVEIANLDLSVAPEAGRLDAGVTAAIETSNRAFELTRDPMLRPLVIKLGEDDYLLLLSMHHIAFDGWSAGVLMRELSAVYASDVSDNGAEASAQMLKPLAIQYADFARWQSEAAYGPAMQESLAWWHDRLAGVPPLLAIPTDRPRPPRETFSGAAVTFVVAKELVDRLKGIARGERATLFMTLLAGFQTMLHRYGAGDDIVVGTPVAGRTRVETEGLIGLFVNILAMRGDLAGDPTFRELIRKTRDRALEAYAHQDLPFDAVVESLHPERNLSYPPIVQATFQVRNYPLEDTRLGRLEVEEIDFDPGVAQFDLSLEVTEKPDRLFCKLIYNRDIFDRETIARMAGHFETLLDGIAVDPDTNISRLPLLTSAERDQLLVEWNDTQRDYPHECVHRLFERQVERTPDAVAAKFGDSEITYADLNARANRIARALHDAGVTPRSLVAICIDRSLGMIAGLLGILKSGAAYIPIDPAFPQERLDFMLEDCAAPVVVTTGKLAEKFAANKVRVVCIDDLEASIERDAGNPQVPVTAEDDAYVLYTSGSTGKPKGVAISHRSFSNLLSAMRTEISFTSDDVLLAVTTLSFDIAGLELFMPLICGGRVVVADEFVADGSRLTEAIEAARPTVIQTAPPLWRTLIASGWRGESKLRIISGGEALTRTLADQLLDRVESVFNAYGPTETTIWSTLHHVERGDGLVPIGHPLANTQVYVLDVARQPLPIGVPGELYIGGDGVARAYLGRPELSAERFVANPFGHGDGGRLYRTGDTVRRLHNGDIEYIGRADNQLKIRGIRIEPGEIEAALMRHPQVQTAAVVGLIDASEAKTLVAFVEAKSGQLPSAAAMRAFLSESLPVHLIPTRFVMVDKIALTHNGKIDRARLPSLDESPIQATQKYTGPRDDIENRLQAIWQEVLPIRPIGVQQDFYEIGGHSLLAVKLLVRIEREFNCRIPLAAMFPAPTIESLAARIARDRRDSARPATEVIQPLGSQPPLFVVGHSPLFKQLALRLGNDRPLIGLSIPDELRMRLPYSLEQFAGIQADSILNLNKGEPIFIIGFSAEGVLAYEVARQLVAAGREVGLVAMIDTACPTQPREPWVVRVAQSVRINMSTIRSVGLGRAPAAIMDVLSRLSLRLKFRAWKLAGRVGVARAPLAPKRPADLVMAMVLATRRYVPPPYRGRVLLFKQTVDTQGRFRLKDYGWGAVLQEGLEVCEITGEHLTLLVEPGVGTVAAKLDAVMKSVCEPVVEAKSAAAG